MFLVDGTAYAVGHTRDLSVSDDLVLRSTDGATWRLGYHNALQFP